MVLKLFGKDTVRTPAPRRKKPAAFRFRGFRKSRESSISAGSFLLLPIEARFDGGPKRSDWGSYKSSCAPPVESTLGIHQFFSKPLSCALLARFGGLTAAFIRSSPQSDQTQRRPLPLAPELRFAWRSTALW